MITSGLRVLGLKFGVELVQSMTEVSLKHVYNFKEGIMISYQLLQCLFYFSVSSSSSFAALFSPAKRRQLEQNLSDSTPRRPILSRRAPGGVDEEDGGFPQGGAAGYRKTGIIPILKRTGKRQGKEELVRRAFINF